MEGGEREGKRERVREVERERERGEDYILRESRELDIKGDTMNWYFLRDAGIYILSKTCFNNID